MSQPTATRELVADILSSSEEAHLATCEGEQPRLRPMSVALVDGYDLYMASFTRWGKVAEIQANPRVEVSYMDERKRHLRITGLAAVADDPATRARVYEAFPLMQRYFDGPEDPRYTLLHVRAARVRVKDTWELDYRELPVG